MRTMRKALLSTPAFYLLMGTAFPQQQATAASNPPPHVPIVRIVLGSSAGMSGCFSHTIIEPAEVRAVGNDADSTFDQDGKLQYTDCPSQTAKTRLKYAIGKKDWHTLQHLAKSLAQLDRSLGEDPALSDGAEDWVELDFSDGMKKSILYDPAKPPPALKNFLSKFSQIERQRNTSANNN